jgi:hypothetical protein
LTVSEANAEQTCAEPVSVSAPAADLSDPHAKPVAEFAEASVADSDPADPSEREVTATAASATGEAEPDAPAAEAPEIDAPAVPGDVILISSREEANSAAAEPKVQPALEHGSFGKRRLGRLAAVVALAMATGALGGALATAGLSRLSAVDVERNDKSAVEASVARIEAELLTLKANVEDTAKLGVSQLKKTGDRLDKLEKAQAEPAAKIAKLSEAVDKLRTSPPVAAAPVAVTAPATKEVTGSITPTAGSTKVEVARLPTVEGWSLRDVANGGALIQSRHGMFEVYAGDAVPGLGRVDAIRRQDGRWVVVTTKGLVVSR